MGKSARAATVAVVAVVGIGGAIYFGVFDRLKEWLLDFQQANPSVPPGTTPPPVVVIPPIVIPPDPITIPPYGGGTTPPAVIPPPSPPTATSQPPDLTVSQPLQNSRHLRRSQVTISGTAAPNVISKSPIARVNLALFRFSGSSKTQMMLYDVNTLSDTTFLAQTPQLIEGNYELTVKAIDNAGKTQARSITFQVVLSLTASTVPYVPPGGIVQTRLAAIAISVMMSLNTRLKDIITGIRVTTNQAILSYYASGAYRNGGGTGFNDGQLQAIEQEANDRLIALGLTVKWP